MSESSKPTKADDATFNELHRLVAEHLVEKLRSGEASASDVANAVKLLIANDVRRDPPPPKYLLPPGLPTFEDEQQ